MYHFKSSLKKKKKKNIIYFSSVTFYAVITNRSSQFFYGKIKKVLVNFTNYFKETASNTLN